MSDQTPPPSIPSPAPNTPPPSPAPNAPPPAAAASVLAAGSPPPNSAPSENMWPEDWREKYANGDEAKAKLLARYATPDKAFEALADVRRKISTGELKVASKPPGADATPEQIAEWRAEQGIPESPDKYDLSLPDGLVIGESDKPLVDSFTKAMHAEHATPGEVKRALTWYYRQQETLAEQQSDRDAANKDKGTEFLKEEWGPEYKRNVAIATEFLKSAPDGIAEKLMNGRMADGTLIAADPTIIQWFNQLQRTINPAATVVPGSGGNPMQAIDTELAALRKEAGDDTSAYWKGPLANQKQARMRELIEARNRSRAQ